MNRRNFLAQTSAWAAAAALPKASGAASLPILEASAEPAAAASKAADLWSQLCC